MYAIVNTAPVFGSRDEIVSYQSYRFVDYVYENRKAALGMCARLNATVGRVEGFADDIDLDVIDLSTGTKVYPPVAEFSLDRVRCSENDPAGCCYIPF